jgi:TusA-related sulfurtransferase
MKKLVSELKRGDKIKLLYDEIGVVENVVKDEKIPRAVVVNYQDGTKTYALYNDKVELHPE